MSSARKKEYLVVGYPFVNGLASTEELKDYVSKLMAGWGSALIQHRPKRVYETTITKCENAELRGNPLVVPVVSFTKEDKAQKFIDTLKASGYDSFMLRPDAPQKYHGGPYLYEGSGEIQKRSKIKLKNFQDRHSGYMVNPM